MAHKKFVLEDRTKLSIYKRRGNRYLRLSISSSGEVRVSIPTWLPYRAGLEFAKSRKKWILSNQPGPKPSLQHGQAVGKAHHLYFVQSLPAAKPSSRIKLGQIVIKHPTHLDPSHADVQKIAEKAALRALKTQAENLLPQRLEILARQHDFEYRNIKIKQMKSRWGSCDSKGNIVLNLFLMQLPWECIDYVLLHELTHTRMLRHGPDFWQAMEKVLPDVKRIRRNIRGFRPVLEAAFS